MIRVAKAKYMDTSRYNSYAEALKHMFELMQREYPLIGWNRWRRERLWRPDVANLFALNEENLRLIFEHFSRDPKK